MRTRQKRKQKRKYVKRRKTRRIRGGSRDITFYNKYHYGDHLFNLKFLYNISNKLKEMGIRIRYLYDANYIKNPDELRRYVDPAVVTLDTMNHLTPGAIELWMGNPINNLVITRSTEKNSIGLDIYFDLFYKKVLSYLGVDPASINTSLYQHEPYLQDIYTKLNPKFKDLDILIINAEPKSGQVIFHKKHFEEMCKRLATKYRVAITSPIHGAEAIPCTMRDGLMLQDIGAVSTHAKYIIAIHSGPVVPCFNAATKAHVRKWVLFADNGTYHSQINAKILPNNYDYRMIETELD